MKKIRYALEMEIPPSRFPFSHDAQLMFLGSCFSENISEKLRTLSWKVESMPNGIVFNPFSLSDPLKRIIENRDYTESDLILHNGFWHGKYHHGSFSESNISDALRKMNHALHEFKRAFSKSSHLFITFGTAFAYRFIDSGETFANCHKIPQSQFDKYLLKADEIVDEWMGICSSLHQLFPDLKLIFTVSPVKHLRDGVVENLHSKSILISAVHELVDKLDYSEYFPAFELVNEDLRDYRFFDNDGAHPNAMAIEYVFDRFCSTYLDDPGISYLKDMVEYVSMTKHRIIKEEGEDYVRFMANLEEKRKKIKSIYNVDL